SLTTPPVATTGVTPVQVSGFSLIAEDGNALPGASRVQSEVFMAAGKTYDVMIDAPAAGGTALPVYDRELSLSGNSTARDAGMLAYLGVNGGGLPTAPVIAAAVANPDTYNSVIAGQTLRVLDPGKGVIANDVNVNGVQLLAPPAGGTVTLNANGTFTYVPNAGTNSDAFTYCANGSVAAGVCSSGVTATVTLGTGDTTSTVACAGGSYNANTSSYLAIKTPGVLASCTDSKGYALTATAFIGAGVTVVGDANGGFTATLATPCTAAAGCPTSFTFQAKNSQGIPSPAATVNVTFPAGSGLAVKVVDGADKTTEITDYRWIIEEDRTFYVDPNCTTNSATPITGCTPPTGTTVPPSFGVNFHTSYMPLVAAGCTGPLSCEGGQTVFDPATGMHVAAVCDVGNGVCRPDPSGGSGFATLPTGSVHLDPTKRYYVSVLPGDAANPFGAAYGGAPDCSPAGAAAGNCGHGMGGVPIPALVGTTTYPTTPYTILTQPTPFPPAQLSVFVFEDDFPLNGEHDAGGGTAGVNTTNEPGLGGFEITLFDDAGGTGDATGQLTHDMFNQPLSNSLAGTIDPLSGLDACPITKKPLVGMDTSNGNAPGSVGIIGITGRIVTCPEFEADGATPSPLAGQAVIPNMMQG
ncbi:MAG: Ig-like domain-containing protein, partial [Acidobacteria bacterium Pan2503]|nr:Ig-like domain-containing protein [Candidatus Acidoferrum panamensis]